MSDFEKNVFVNCPYDDEYRQMLIAIVFTISFMGYKPRLALENADSGQSRIDKILNLIDESKFGIHDLSRIKSSSEDEHYRMNMPFELGIDFGCKRLKTGKWDQKQILILEKEAYRYQKALSDLSGSDIKNHDNSPEKAINIVRNWLKNIEKIDVVSGHAIWNHLLILTARYMMNLLKGFNIQILPM